MERSLWTFFYFNTFFQALKKDLRSVLGNNTEITEKVGRLEIKGDHSFVLKEWLKHVGF
jgi:hypothetical protein